MLEQVLPIGTVVMLKGGIKRAMIMGYQQIPQDNKNKVYDYAGCPYPEGYLGADKMLMFDHSQIEHIYAMGLQNPEQMAFRKDLESELDRLGLRK